MGFSWSFSKYKAYETCPKRHYEVDLAKNFADSTEQLKWGNQVHDALAKACEGKAPLPDSMKDWQKWVDEMKDSPTKPGLLKVEMKMALTRDFQPTDWFAPNVWMRGVCDAARIGRQAAFARDWKTGKIKHDSRQLMIMAQCLFVYFPSLQRIQTEFVWLNHDCVTPETFERDTIIREWPPVLQTVKDMEEASRTLNYPPKPSKLCRQFCPVMSCPYHGKAFTG